LKRILIIGLGVLAIAGIILGIGVKQMREISDEKSLNIQGIDEILVTMTSAQVHLIREETGYEVRFHYYGISLQEIKLVAENSNQTLSVSAKRKYAFLGTVGDTRLDIFLPANYQQKMRIKTSSGKVIVDSLDLAEFTLTTSSGGLEAENINAGRVTLNASSGKLSIRRLSADELELKGTSSSVNIGECIVKGTRIKTTSGSVAVTYREFENQNVAIDTTSGSVTLGLPDTAGFSIDAKMTPGKFRSDFQFGSGTSTASKISGQTGTPDSTISVHAAGGQIEIVKMADK
jgi:lia operon protein LiaG